MIGHILYNTFSGAKGFTLSVQKPSAMARGLFSNNPPSPYSDRQAVDWCRPSTVSQLGIKFACKSFAIVLFPYNLRNLGSNGKYLNILLIPPKQSERGE